LAGTAAVSESRLLNAKSNFGQSQTSAYQILDEKVPSASPDFKIEACSFNEQFCHGATRWHLPDSPQNYSLEIQKLIEHVKIRAMKQLHASYMQVQGVVREEHLTAWK
jgi:hypothetical protein